MSTELTIPLRSHDEAILVLGPYDRHAKLLRQSLDIELFTRGGNLRLKGQEAEVEAARVRIEHLLGKHRKGRELKPREIEAILLDQEAALEQRANGNVSSAAVGSVAPRAAPRPSGPRALPGPSSREDDPTRGFPRRTLDANAALVSRSLRINAVEPRTQSQRRYLEAIEKTPLVFGLGAAGTGKTFLAAAAAVRALRDGQVRRLILTRPVVEAGERLGFLPGDLHAKLDPYMRPIYDSLYDLLSFEDVARLEDYNVIEIAPLAYMRGRTLSHAFVILDEAQNTTVSQMKMFLTRMGEGSRVVVTGDPSQSDLERGKQSGLPDAVKRLRGFAGISVVEFGAKDIVRHPLVEQIVRAYEGTRSDAGDKEPSPMIKAEMCVAEPSPARLELDLVAAPELLELTGANPRALARIAAAALDHLNAGRPLLALAVVDDRDSGEYHARSHGDPQATDVISVELGAGQGPLGELVVNAEMAVRVARERGVAPARELALYVVHGILHLFGFDDHEPAERQRMRVAERAVLDRLGFPADLAPHDRGD